MPNIYPIHQTTPTPKMFAPKSIRILFFSLVISALVLISNNAKAQAYKVPEIDLKTVDGKNFNIRDLDNGGKPIIISFWATWCKPCIVELTNIEEYYAEWQKETGVKLVAISIDDMRNSFKVGPFASGKSWTYEIYLDVNQDFKRAMNVNDIPATFVLNDKKEIVWQHTGYNSGDEQSLLEVIRKVAKGENPKHK